MVDTSSGMDFFLIFLAYKVGPSAIWEEKSHLFLDINFGSRNGVHQSHRNNTISDMSVSDSLEETNKNLKR